MGYFRLRKILPASIKTRRAETAEEARQRVLHLYRQCLRQSPEIQMLYPLDVPLHQMRQKFRSEFERNRHVTSLATINVLLSKGHMELEEMLHMWKTHGSTMDFFTHGPGAVREDDAARELLPEREMK